MKGNIQPNLAHRPAWAYRAQLMHSGVGRIDTMNQESTFGQTISAVINGELAIELPAGFRTMGSDELARAFSSSYPDIQGFWDESRHIIISIMWKTSNGLVSKMADAQSLVKRANKLQSRTYRGHDYRSEGFFEMQLAGQEAHGVRYRFVTQGVDHAGETIVFKRGACCYTLYYYTHSSLEQENRPTHDAILGSLSFV